MTTQIYSHQDLMQGRTNFNQSVPVIAHGDSWGSFGSLPPWITGSLFNQMDFGKDVGIVNYAMPGQLLRDLPDPRKFPTFHLAMTLRGMPDWRAMLISGGGNDLIDWARRGPGYDLTQRVLRHADEFLPPDHGPSRYLSQTGWTHLCEELLDAYLDLDALRDQNYPRMEIITHVYDYMTPRFAPAVGGVSGPWLAPAFTSAGIPAGDWQAAARVLVDWFHDFLEQRVKTTIGGFVVLDTRGGSVPAAPGTTGISNDWANEIHLTAAGYRRLATATCNPDLQAHAAQWTTGEIADTLAAPKSLDFGPKSMPTPKVKAKAKGKSPLRTGSKAGPQAASKSGDARATKTKPKGAGKRST